MTEPWQEMLSDEQRRLFNAACGDLAKHLTWHGFKLSKDDFRHLISGTVLGWRILPGIDMGEGYPGLIMLGGSSLDLRKEKCTEAIEIAFHVGDCPEEYGLNQKPVPWCDVILLARGFQPSDFREK